MHIVSSCCSFFSPLLEPLTAFSSKMEETASSIKGRLVQTFSTLNYHYGFTRGQWLEITKIALRALAPFVAALLVIFTFPLCAAKILLPPVVIGVIFLSAFYDLHDPTIVSEESELARNRG